MARLDAFLEVLFRDQARALVIESGSVAYLETEAGPKALMKRELSRAHIVAAVGELLPPYEAKSFDGTGSIEYEYAAPSGRVQVTFDPQAGGGRAVLRPTARREAAAPAEPKRQSISHAHPGYHVVSVPQPAPVVVVEAPVETRPTIKVGPAPAVAAEAMRALLDLCVEHRASDLHLTSAFVPCLRVDGDMVPLEGCGPTAAERLREMLWTLAPQQNREQWEATRDTDFAYEIPTARFRVNLYANRDGIGAVLRQIPSTVRSAEELNLSKPVLDLCYLTKGLVLVTGPTGSGKSTTLAAMIDHINRNRDDHILTIEDPIEFVYPHQRCLVHQREVGTHTGSFKHALRAALREDPDVVMVGEMRDLETISIALETAETGHLVFGTLHTNTAMSTVDRIIDQFPADRQQQVRTMLASSLKGVIAQTLCKKVGGGRVAAQEILLCNSAVANLIREGKTFQLQTIMQTGRASGMTTLNDALLDLVQRKLVLPKEALATSVARAELRSLLERSDIQPERIVETPASSKVVR